jgi:DNA-binding GntR family transcriptional regulator
MIRPGTFERVYTALKQQLGDGPFRPGERLEPAVLSDQLNASVTPVRDALHRLTGERLVEAPRHDGFRVPLLTETMLRHLYAWHLDILLLAIARPGAERPGELPAKSEGGADERLKLAFAELATISNNPEHLAALRNAAERLEPYQRLEREFLDAVEDETEEIVAAIRARDRKALRRSLVHYHRRRQRVVPALLDKLHDS